LIFKSAITIDIVTIEEMVEINMLVVAVGGDTW
jgi:hypothetical protein